MWGPQRSLRTPSVPEHLPSGVGKNCSVQRSWAIQQPSQRLLSGPKSFSHNQDPLPAAFSATLGRLLPLGGAEGVALLLTMVVELMSCFGLAGLSALHRGRDEREPGTPDADSLAAGVPVSLEAEGGTPPATRQSPSLRTLPKPSLKPAATGRGSFRKPMSREASKSPSNVVPMRPGHPSTSLPEGASLTAQGRIPEIEIASHVPAFVRERLETSSRSSLAAGELHVAYEAWCGTHNYKPLSMPKFAAELKALGYRKWKSCGLIRYRGLRFAA